MSLTEDIKTLREQTGAGMLDCKKALEQNGGNMDKAADWLREQGISKAAKKASRIAAEGSVFLYNHMNGKIGVMLELNCESDFVAKNEDFQALGHDICLHIAANAPKYVRREEVDGSELEKEREILRAQVINEGKPEAMADKIVDGKIKKYYKDVCLVEQDFVKNPDITVEQLVNEAILKIGEKITIRRFARFVMGEGLEKKNENFAEEIDKQIKG
ncbi:MAG: translation elongation factor Ts [Clostridiales bacterium]|nr:translation elongation factor Ts [Clostridiales bacterium]